MDNLFPTLEVDTSDEEYIQLKLDEYRSMCDAINQYKTTIASYEAVITKLQEVVNAQDATINEIRQIIQQTHINSSQALKFEKVDSINF